MNRMMAQGRLMKHLWTLSKSTSPYYHMTNVLKHSRWKSSTGRIPEKKRQTIEIQKHCQKQTMSTLPQTSSDMALNSASLCHPDHVVKVQWTNGEETMFPYPWLRDNCQCMECFNSTSVSRSLLLQQLDPEIMAKDVQATENELTVTWPDGHQSTFDSQWLLERNFTESAKRLRDKWFKIKPKKWGSEMLKDLPKISFNELMESDETLFKWLTHLEEIGICLLTNAPCQAGQLEKVAQRVAFLRNQAYGTTFQVKAKLDASNLAYTPKTLGLHCDLVYYDYVPGMQMLHCIAQVPTEGGENFLADGFHAAEVMRREQPDNFKLLSTVPIDHFDNVTDVLECFNIARAPVFCLDAEGNVERINHNNMQRDSFWNHMPVEQVYPMFKALRAFDDLMYQPENHIEYKLREGDIVCFHNYRVLHGRTGYTPKESGERFLEGGYLDWDEMRSKRRVLKQKFGFTD